MKEKILKLFQEGKNMHEISRELQCAYSTVQYHVNPTYRKHYIKNKDTKRRIKRQKLKLEFGGKCSICKYDKCLDALHFHHPNDDKEYCVGRAMNHGYNAAKKEALKCQLVCANCHAEIHSKIEKG